MARPERVSAVRMIAVRVPPDVPTIAVRVEVPRVAGTGRSLPGRTIAVRIEVRRAEAMSVAMIVAGIGRR